QMEINLVVNGSGSVLLEDRKYPLLPGHLIWIWPGQRHVPANWSPDMLMWIVEWHPDHLKLLKRERSTDRPRPADGDAYFCRRLDSRALQVAQGILSGAAAAERADAFNLGLRFALLALWDEFIKAEPVAREEFLHPKLRKAIGRLNDPRGEETLAQLARDVGLSSSHLSVLFRNQTGLSIPDYRNRVRLNAFFALYREKPGVRLLTLAFEAGFGSYAQFYRVFTESVGQTPKRWLESTRE
ncbi:MAG: AraC family transcriptional regulator, partial [Kiritimatiellae bacterium]|nr:AraC family transcriptional regulator [Kiritimatiellia bacterium]